MKRTVWLGVCLSVVFGLALVSPTWACIDPATGEAARDADGNMMKNCMSAAEVEEVMTTGVTESYSTSVEEVDFGRLTEASRSYTKTFSVTNHTKEKIVVRAEVIKYENDKVSDEYKKAVDWLTFVGGVRRFEIPADSSANISVRVATPEELPGTTQYATVRLLDENGFERKVDVRMDLVTENFKYGGEVTENSLGFISVQDKINGAATIKNNGTASFKAKYFVQYKKALGLSDWQTIVDIEEDVAPGTEVRMTTDDSGAVTVGYGIFKVEQKIVYVNSESKQVEVTLSHTVINVPIWLLCVIGGVIVAIIVLIIVIKAVRRKKDQDDDDDDEDDDEKPAKKAKTLKKAKK